MFCRKCGNELREGTKFCTKCGHPVTPPAQKVEQNAQPSVQTAERDIQPSVRMPEQGVQSSGNRTDTGTGGEYEPDRMPEKRKGGKTGIYIISLIVLVIILLAAAFWYFWDRGPLFGNGEENRRKTEETEETDETTEDEEESEETETSAKEQTEERTEEQSDVEPSETETVSGDDSASKQADRVLGDDSVDGDGIHEYKIVMADVTWMDAFYLSQEVEGGYLVHINTQEEMDVILQMISEQGLDNGMFWIGGTRRDDQEDYYWVDTQGMFVGEPLNGNSFWLDGEPSLHDSTLDMEEQYMNLFYVKSKDRWIWNDTIGDLASIEGYAGKVGYIIEIERQ